MVVIFKIFHLAINLKLENIDKVVIACWILHNFLIKRWRQNYAPSNCFYSEEHETAHTENGLTPEQVTISKTTMTYFNNEVSVLWQQNFI